MCLFQNGFLSSIPFILSFTFAVSGSLAADWLCYRKIITTGEVREVFSTAGEIRESLPYTFFSSFLVVKSKSLSTSRKLFPEVHTKNVNFCDGGQTTC